METLCRIRDLARAVADFEQQFERRYGLSLNEGVLLCRLCRHETLTSGEIADSLQLSCSNASKVIRSVEQKGLVCRKLGDEDKRRMLFSLTPEGRRELERLKVCSVEPPELIRQWLQVR